MNLQILKLFFRRSRTCNFFEYKEKDDFKSKLDAKEIECKKLETKCNSSQKEIDKANEKLKKFTENTDLPEKKSKTITPTTTRIEMKKMVEELEEELGQYLISFEYTRNELVIY